MFDGVEALKPAILVFLPTPNEVQRFVLGGALGGLAQRYRLIFVLPESAYGEMAPLVRSAFPRSECCAVRNDPQRFNTWKELFKVSCYRYALRSRSFALRVDSAYRGRGGKLRLLADHVLPAHKRRLSTLLTSLAAYASGKSRAAIIARRKLLAEANTKKRFFLKEAYDQFITEKLQELGPNSEIEALIEGTQPLFVMIPTSLLDDFCNDVLWSCERLGVVSFALQSGWDNLSTKGIFLHRPSYLGVWGPQSQCHAERIQGMAKTRTIVLGAPHYETLKPVGQAERNAFRARLGVGGDQRLVLFGGSFRQFDETAALRQLDAEITRRGLRDVKVVYRPHPWRLDRSGEDDFFEQHWDHVVFDPEMRERYLRSKREPGYLKRERPLYSMEYLAQLLSSVDAVISPMSTLLLEALIMRRPTMAVAFGDGRYAYDPGVSSQMTHFAELKGRDDALIWCSRERRFLADFDRLLQRTGRWRAASVGELLNLIVAVRPETYGERLVRACCDILERPALKSQQKRTKNKPRLISHHYAADKMAAAYCRCTGGCSIPGYWMHGWLPAYYNRHPGLVAMHKSYDKDQDINTLLARVKQEKRTQPQWVSRQDQVRFLLSQGYSTVEAIGLPFVYLPELSVPRRRGALLVMPPHGRKMHYEGEPLADSYAELIAAIAPQFSEVWVSITESDFTRGEWRRSFEKRGIGVLIGAKPSFANPLLHMKRMLSTFEYVTTNAFGSHIAYAAFCGAKVSVFGPYAEWPADLRNYASRMFPELADVIAEVQSERVMREHYPFLFVDPRDAQLCQDWGAREIGYDNRRTPEELRDLFGWPAPTSAGSPGFEMTPPAGTEPIAAAPPSA